MDRQKTSLIKKKLNDFQQDEGFLENFLSFCLVELENKENHSLPHKLFTTNLYRQPYDKVSPVIKEVVRRGIGYCLSVKKYSKTEDTNLRNYIQDGFLSSKMWQNGNETPKTPQRECLSIYQTDEEVL